ncbi:MAG TPA: HAMP domain-containing sensor histidine kinase [Fibrobacteria bacterium]|nr:HAMP domain-containing sensor histidine kinase [Fibrobacteria bacterium]
MTIPDDKDARIARLEAKLAEAEERLQRQEEFFQMAVHDLRSPLSAIVVYAELLMNRVMGDLDNRQLEPIRTIHRNCNNLIRMAEDVLASAKVRAGAVVPRFEPGDVTEIVRESVRSLQGLADAKNVHISLQQPEARFLRPLDVDFLTRAFSNVLGNAIKFSPHGGEIRIGLECDEREIRVAFTDEGPGISPEKRDEIFQKFRRGDAGSVSGHGLGLSIAQYFIDLHGGRILVEGVRGRGSTFLVGLPVS